MRRLVILGLRRALPLVVGLALLPALVAAEPGDSLDLKVRLAWGPLLTGRGLASPPATLTFVPDGRADTLKVSVASIRELRVRRGDQSHFWAGVAIGAGVGALAGAFAGYASGDDPCDPNELLCLGWTAGVKAGVGAMF